MAKIEMVKDSLELSSYIGNKHFGEGLHTDNPYHNKLVIVVDFLDTEGSNYRYVFIVKPKKKRTIYLAGYHAWSNKEERMLHFFCPRRSKSYLSFISGVSAKTECISGAAVIKEMPLLAKEYLIIRYNSQASSSPKSIKPCKDR